MYDNEYSWLYKESVTSEAIDHSSRIIWQHTGYISNYLNYIIRYVPTNKFTNSEDKEQLINEIRNELLKYEQKLEKLIKENPNYFKK